MTDTNPRPWRDRITATGECGLTWPSDVNLYPAVRGLLAEAHALAAEVERLRTLLATPADGPLRVVRMDGESFDELWCEDEFLCLIVNPEEADAIEAQIAARPAHDLPDGVQPWTAPYDTCPHDDPMIHRL